MSLTPGTRLGAHEVIAAIGQGGMGEVYRGRDTRLDRDVAIKILPEAFAYDSERVARFLREAKTLASLNHPNIGGIYGLEEAPGITALVLELVEGPTLADRIAQGPIAVEEALPIAKQIAEAIEAAHEHSVIHRDLKPANIKLRPDGTIKVLDFGLAKAFEGEPASVGAGTMAPTITSPAATRLGVILGTAAYMSPEQARGKTVDKRTDIWAFGCVLYEMLTGRRAFEGDETTEVLARVLERQPDLAVLPPKTPEAIRRLLRRCLQKDASARLRDIADARLEIDEARLTSASPHVPSEQTAGFRFLRLVAASVAGMGLILIAWYLGARRPAASVEPQAAQVQIALPAGVYLAVDTEHPALALSPDGSQLVFVGDDAGRRQLYVREMAVQETKVLPATEDAASPFYSPDGSWIGFFAGELLKKVSPTGGVAIAVHASTGTTVNRGATWTAKDTAVLAQSPNSGLNQGSLAGERLRAINEWTWITDNALPYAWPDALPDGDHILFTDNTGGTTPENARVALLSLGTRQIRTVANGGTNPRYSSTGHVLFARSGAIYSVPFDARRMEPTGAERLLLRGVISAPNGSAQFSVAANGTLAYVAGTATPTQDEIVWVDRTGRTEMLLDDGRTYEDPRLSPDGTRLAFTSPDGANFDVWVRDLSRGSNTRVTTHPGEDFEAVWSPDGRQLAFASEIDEDPGNPGPGLAWVPALGARPEQLLRSPGFGNWEMPLSWSPDGRWLLFSQTQSGAPRDLMLFPTTGTRVSAVFLRTPADEAGATFSPDGRWIAYVSDETGRQEVYIRPFPGPGAPVTISAEGGIEPRWSRSGRELFYRSGNRVMVVTIAPGTPATPSAPAPLFEGRFERKGYGGSSANYDVASDGRFIMIRPKNAVTPTVINVVFNWPRALGIE